MVSGTAQSCASPIGEIHRYVPSAVLWGKYRSVPLAHVGTAPRFGDVTLRCAFHGCDVGTRVEELRTAGTRFRHT